jgi:hypothetical protein
MMRQLTIMVALAACLMSAAVGAEMSPEQAEKVKYAKGLSALGLYEFAEIVFKDTPDHGNKAIILAKLQVFIHRNRGDAKKIEAYIKKRAGDDAELYWMMRIRLADAYWAWGQPGKSLKIYEEFMQFYQDLLDEPRQQKRPGKPGVPG